MTIASSMHIPILDLSGLSADALRNASSLGQAVDAALSDVGTFIVIGHGIPHSTLAAVESSARAFFDEPSATKRRAARPQKPAVARGYFNVPPNEVSVMGMERFSFGAWDCDTSDSYYGAPEGREHFPPNMFPAEHAAFEQAARTYFGCVQDVSGKLAILFELALSLPAGTFVDPLIGSTGTATAIRYPGGPRTVPGDVRIMAHNDVDLYTILWISECVRTDLVFLDRHDQWNEVSAVPDGLIVNVGDLMQRHTNDRWLATSHKVLAPSGTDADHDRFSLAYFEHPRYDSEVAPLVPAGSDAHYPSVRVADFERQRRMLIHLGASAVTEELIAPIERRLGPSATGRKT